MLLGHRLLVSFLQKQSVKEYYDAKLSEAYFVAEELEIFKIIEKHLDAHGVLPKVATVKEVVGDLPEDISEPTSYYLQKVEERFGFTTFNTALKEAGDLLKKKDITALTSLMEDTLHKVKSVSYTHLTLPTKRIV